MYFQMLSQYLHGPELFEANFASILSFSRLHLLSYFHADGGLLIVLLGVLQEFFFRVCCEAANTTRMLILSMIGCHVYRSLSLCMFAC